MLASRSPSIGVDALVDLRRRRSRRHLDELAWVDTLYRVYLTVAFAATAIALVSGALADATVDHSDVLRIAGDGPAAVGVLVAVAIAAGLRSGARGGPLAIEDADVQHVLLSPVDRGFALRRAALPQLRTMILVGAVIGAIAGNFAFRRLPGPDAEWLACAAAFGGLVPLLALSAAIAASGHRLRPRVASVFALAIIAWSGADLALGTRTSPATMIGELALWPIHRAGESFVWPAVGIALALGLSTFALLGIAGTSLEAAKRRAGLVAELRWALTVQDLRTVVLLRRALAGEMPRRRPWAALAGLPGSADAVWIRGWQSFMRWPAARVVRVAALAVVAGVALCGFWAGTTPLILVAGAALAVAGFDVIEPLAQETDHPTRRDLLPDPAASLIRRHLLAPASLMLAIGLIAIGAAMVVAPFPLTLELGAVTLVPAAILLTAASALSATSDPLQFLLNPQVAYVYSFAPLALALLAISPPATARIAASNGASPVAAAASESVIVVGASAAAIWWLGRRIVKRTPTGR